MGKKGGRAWLGLLSVPLLPGVTVSQSCNDARAGASADDRFLVLWRLCLWLRVRERPREASISADRSAEYEAKNDCMRVARSLPAPRPAADREDGDKRPERRDPPNAVLAELRLGLELPKPLLLLPLLLLAPDCCIRSNSFGSTEACRDSAGAVRPVMRLSAEGGRSLPSPGGGTVTPVSCSTANPTRCPPWLRVTCTEGEGVSTRLVGLTT